jgi:hypothetical protein
MVFLADNTVLEVGVMMDREALICRLSSYENAPVEIGHALETLGQRETKTVSNEDIGFIWERVSKAIDSVFSDDAQHDAWQLEQALAQAYKRD